MLKILRKTFISSQDLEKIKRVNQFKISPKYIRTVLELDGSMTKFAMNLSDSNTKPVIKIINEK